MGASALPSGEDESGGNDTPEGPGVLGLTLDEFVRGEIRDDDDEDWGDWGDWGNDENK